MMKSGGMSNGTLFQAVASLLVKVNCRDHARTCKPHGRLMCRGNTQMLSADVNFTVQTTNCEGYVVKVSLPSDFVATQFQPKDKLRCH